MSVKQFRLQSANVSGKLSYLSDVLAKHGVNIRAISVGLESQEVSSICVVVDDPKKAKNAFASENVEYQETDVLAVEMPDHPGGMNAVLKPLRDAKINAIAMYPYIGRANNPIIIMEVDNIKVATDVLKRNWVKLWDKEVYRL
ncbi:MAG TPA: hypothetical protein PLP82_02345 [Deltaproteobacteria bacterium]|jgi:hypothetical protein|nr:hypothetical protein [Deltaproteobacteria bacterium]OQC23837.1 MAG: ACT domain protein [Deltaproteobacteria bacterium ADurb.Bin072]HRW79498.1 hypothetical protein [Desulfomonilia bacterium]HNQ85279.1 hypothetical protein [Deltaproteobacteria bacterium]HNS89552.1 hypothetical protein [Deltaproteobacteria bacterium]